MNVVLRIEDLAIDFRTYEGLAHVVDRVNIHIGEREIVGLVGESGCGKTVTAKAVMGILPIQARIIRGKILFKDTDLLQLSQQERHLLRGRETAFIPQDPMSSLNPVFTVEDQMLAWMKWRGTYDVGFFDYVSAGSNRKEKEKMKKAALDMLEKVRIPDPERVLGSYPVQLSGGMRQRVLIAMALMGKPSLIIADEPGTGLDVSIQDQILDLIEQRVREEGVSVLYITHDLGVTRRLCDRIYVMYAGTVAETASRRDIFAAPSHPYTVGLLDSVPKVSKGIGKGIPGIIPNYYDPPQGCRFHPRCPFNMPVCERVRPSLQKVDPGHGTACHLYSENEILGQVVA